MIENPTQKHASKKMLLSKKFSRQGHKYSRRIECPQKFSMVQLKEKAHHEKKKRKLTGIILVSLVEAHVCLLRAKYENTCNL